MNKPRTKQQVSIRRQAGAAVLTWSAFAVAFTAAAFLAAGTAFAI